MEPQIKETTNYDMFLLRSWNRDIKQSNLKKIDKMVKKNGWLKHPITVNEKMEIIDGQHRYVYAKEHNLPVYYIVVQGLDMNDCVIMNNTRMQWTMTDYIKYFAEQGNQDYILLQGLIEKYPFVAPTMVSNIVANSVASSQSGKCLREGTFTMTYSQYQRAVKKLDFLAICADTVLKAPGRPSALFTAIAFTYDLPGVDKKRLQRNILNHIGMITPPANSEMAIKAVELLYNYHAPRKQYVNIFNIYSEQSRLRSLKNLNSYNKGDETSD